VSTYNPYAVIERPRLGVFDGLPSAPPGTVLVVDREGHPVRALLAHSDRLTAGEARWGRIRTLYRVDVAEHPLEFADTFPCGDDIGGFRATIKFTCRVVDAEAVVQRGIRDVARTLVPLLTETLRRTCETFAAEDHDDAERAALAAVRAREADGGHDPAFEITQISVVLTLDEAAAKFFVSARRRCGTSCVSRMPRVSPRKRHSWKRTWPARVSNWRPSEPNSPRASRRSTCSCSGSGSDMSTSSPCSDKSSS